MVTRFPQYILLLSCLFFTATGITETDNRIEYNQQQDELTLDIQDAALGEVLQQLADTVVFTLSIDDEDIHQKVTLSMTGSSAEVIKQLVKSSSLILSQAGNAPHKVTSVTLLPLGTSGSRFLPRKPLSPPTETDDLEKYEKHMKHYQKKLKQQTEVTHREPRERPTPLYRKVAPSYKPKQSGYIPQTVE